MGLNCFKSPHNHEENRLRTPDSAPSNRSAILLSLPQQILTITIISLFLPTALFGHGGRTDSLGCHHDRKNGGYHCHSGPLSGQSFGSKEEALCSLEGSSTELGINISSPWSLSGAAPYHRDLYGGWIDADGDCQNTRQEVLIAESLVPAKLENVGCRVISGKWLDFYTGQTFTNPSDLDIDHFIPLAEAHRSGSDGWLPERRRNFANDLSYPGSLVAVSASVNRSKGDRDPSGWLPPNVEFICEYTRNWVNTKGYWGLKMDDAERIKIDSVLEQCE